MLLCAKCQPQAKTSKGGKQGHNVNYNLRFGAEKLRTTLDTTKSYMVACIFSHFAPQWKSMLSPDDWNKVVQRFKRGAMDIELMEKGMVQNGDVTAKSFRFLINYYLMYNHNVNYYYYYRYYCYKMNFDQSYY